MSLLEFALSHVPQMLATAGLVAYALKRNKLTTGGIISGILVALIHMVHPWPAFFWLLISFFLFGTVVTKVGKQRTVKIAVSLARTHADILQIGHAQKSFLTQSSTGGSGGEGARTSAQVFCNSGFACMLIAMHTYLLNSMPFISSSLPIAAGPHMPKLERLLPIGIVAQYAAVAADTFSSELGILAQTMPFLITAPWKRVPRGTNGGVTIDGLLYGGLGGFLLTFVSIIALYFSPPRIAMAPATAGMLTLIGLIGSIIDSLLGALVQTTVTDKKTGRVVEGPGGQRVRVDAGGSRARIGLDLLTNNGVNFAMASITSVLAMGVAYIAGLELTAG